MTAQNVTPDDSSRARGVSLSPPPRVLGERSDTAVFRTPMAHLRASVNDGTYPLVEGESVTRVFHEVYGHPDAVVDERVCCVRCAELEQLDGRRYKRGPR